MTGRWVQDSENILNKIRKSTKGEGQDRLDLVRVIRFTLFALQRSLAGWMEWANNPDVMAEFSLEELKEINKNLSELACTFVEYDIKVTGSKERRIKEEKSPHRPERKLTKTKRKEDIFYVK